MALDWARPALRYRVYIMPPNGRRVLWDDCNTEDEAHELGASTHVPYQVIDTHSTTLPWRQK